jgi:hypothetical protein
VFTLNLQKRNYSTKTVVKIQILAAALEVAIVAPAESEVV